MVVARGFYSICSKLKNILKECVVSYEYMYNSCLFSRSTRFCHIETEAKLRTFCRIIDLEEIASIILQAKRMLM
jgi:hypothetical protein